MAYKSFKPYTPGRRQMTVSTFEEITTDTQEKSLLAELRKNTESSISREIKMVFRLKSQPLNTIQTVPAASHCCSMQMVKNATSSLRKV